MTAYSASSQEALRARRLLKDWAGEGHLTELQYRQMLQETDCGPRCTNIFLRLVLFLFTLIMVGTGVSLFFVIFRLRLGAQGGGFSCSSSRSSRMRPPSLRFRAAISIATESRRRSRSAQLPFSAWECKAFCSAVPLICPSRTRWNFWYRRWAPSLRS